MDGEEPRQEEGLCSEQDRLLGVLEEEPPPAEDNETRAESHEGEGHWDELDESELERLGIQIHVMASPKKETPIGAVGSVHLSGIIHAHAASR